MNCFLCGKSLSGGTDTFGTVTEPLCWDCYAENMGDIDQIDTFYGLGPHVHSYDENGNIVIGGTTFLPLPAPNENGEIVIDGYVFTPDKEDPALGVWRKYRPAGWR